MWCNVIMFCCSSKVCGVVWCNVIMFCCSNKVETCCGDVVRVAHCGVVCKWCVVMWYGVNGTLWCVV